MKSKNESIFVHILEQDRQNSRERTFEEEARKAHMYVANEKNYCLKCKKAFSEPKLVQYNACPHCLKRLPENIKEGCQHWFGFLGQSDRAKDGCDSVPQECVECEKVLDCMLNKYYDSTDAVSEIKKWY